MASSYVYYTGCHQPTHGIIPRPPGVPPPGWRAAAPFAVHLRLHPQLRGLGELQNQRPILEVAQLALNGLDPPAFSMAQW